MAYGNKTIEITITNDNGIFNSLFKKIVKGTEEEYDFTGIKLLRKLLTNKKAKILYLLKTKKPKSIYLLAKMAERGFKSVSEDIKFLEKIGLIDIIAEKTGKRTRLRPILTTENLIFKLKI